MGGSFGPESVAGLGRNTQGVPNDRAIPFDLLLPLPQRCRTSREREDTALREAIDASQAEHPTAGYRQVQAYLRRRPLGDRRICGIIKLFSLVERHPSSSGSQSPWRTALSNHLTADCATNA